MADDKDVFILHFSIDADKPGLRCKVSADPRMSLAELARKALAELNVTHPMHLIGANLNNTRQWIYLYGQLGDDVEELEPHLSLYDLAIFPGGTIYIGPKSDFSPWLKGT